MSGERENCVHNMKLSQQMGKQTKTNGCTIQSLAPKLGHTVKITVAHKSVCHLAGRKVDNACLPKNGCKNGTEQNEKALPTDVSAVPK